MIIRGLKRLFHGLREASRNVRERKPDEIAEIVDDTIMYTDRQGRLYSMHRSNVQEIAVVTTDTGPFLEDVFWAMSDGDEEFWIPQGANGFGSLLAFFQGWPGFDNDSFIKAMCCADNQRFVCWKKSWTT